jgi:Raf kinase inhibitor-like YbhB/YbcL family protein
MKTPSLLFALTLSFFLVQSASAAPFAIVSPDYVQGQKIADQHVANTFGCTGKNIAPAISWKDAPADTKSFAVTLFDPDAPTGSGWWHWVVTNIPASATELKPGALPSGAVESNTDFGKPGYGGPCPPAGDKPHRYILTVHALKIDKLPLDGSSPGAMAGFYIKSNEIAKAQVTARYSR